MDSIEGVRAASGGLFVLALFVSLLSGKTTGFAESLSQLGLLLGGVIAGLVLSFAARAVSSGPGTLFPLVLAFAGIMSAVPTFAGWGLGAAIRALGGK